MGQRQRLKRNAAGWQGIRGVGVAPLNERGQAPAELALAIWANGDLPFKQSQRRRPARLHGLTRVQVPCAEGGPCDGHVSEELRQDPPETNFYGGDNAGSNIGFCGPKDNNGWWNPRN